MKYYLIGLFLTICSAIFGQSADSTTAAIIKRNEWIQTITQKAIAIPSKKESFHEALAGYALYFSPVDSFNVPYLVFVPKTYNPTQEDPLVVYLHGGIGSIDSFEYKDPDFAEEPIFTIADKYNVVVVFPFGKKDFGWTKQLKAFENIITIIGQGQQVYHINKHKIYIGGMSNGATATFCFITNKPELFAGFYSFSPWPKLKIGEINYHNITKEKPLYSINAKDDSVFRYIEVKAIYDLNKKETSYWHFDSIENGGHGFIYADNGTIIIDSLFNKLLNKKE